ncbi:MAG TPA: peptidylprolyl isomerase [Candidatus Polarisedimenticolaceae bacterium]|nr:peptidylprolyl isomerase [Candidatus Polarisedimenticolaceae bacterium]
MIKARARHILVESAASAENLIKQLESGADFAELARRHSSCPSGKEGGDLGEFQPGQMVREFDDVVFRREIGKPHGPVKTEFGFHVIEILSRTG